MHLSDGRRNWKGQERQGQASSSLGLTELFSGAKAVKRGGYKVGLSPRRSTWLQALVMQACSLSKPAWVPMVTGPQPLNFKVSMF